MLEELAHIIRTARHIAALTGAGVSAESGIPTFRDALTGLWATFNPQELATPEAFQRNPRMVWEWYDYRRHLLADVQPNPAHLALAEIEGHVPHMTLITQNIDSLHQRAGSQHVIELHGNLQRSKCFRENTIVESWADTGDVPPRCPNCGAPLRPDVVWFGELLPAEQLTQARDAALDCDVFMSIGTSGQVEPAASLPYLAMRHNATIVIINPEVQQSTSRGYYSISEKAGVFLPQLVRAAWPLSS